jgi:hypothetical protein
MIDTAVLVIDMPNSYQHPDADTFRRGGLDALERTRSGLNRHRHD